MHHKSSCDRDLNTFVDVFSKPSPSLDFPQESLELANQADEAFDLVEAALQKHAYFSQPPTPPPPQLSTAASGSTSSFMPSSGMHTANNPSPSMLPTDGYDTTPGGGSMTVGMMGHSVGVQVSGMLSGHGRWERLGSPMPPERTGRAWRQPVRVRSFDVFSNMPGPSCSKLARSSACVCM